MTDPVKILNDIQDCTMEIKQGNHTIVNTPNDIENLATAVYNLSVLMEALIDDKAK